MPVYPSIHTSLHFSFFLSSYSWVLMLILKLLYKYKGLLQTYHKIYNLWDICSLYKQIRSKKIKRINSTDIPPIFIVNSSLRKRIRERSHIYRIKTGPEVSSLFQRFCHPWVDALTKMVETGKTFGTIQARLNAFTFFFFWRFGNNIRWRPLPPCLILRCVPQVTTPVSLKSVLSASFILLL